MNGMLCPMCEWIVGPLTDMTGENPTLPEDNLVTQLTLMAEHVREDHGGIVGGR